MFCIIDIMALIVEVASELLSLFGTICQIKDRFNHYRFKIFLAPRTTSSSNNGKVFGKIAGFI
ncbi:Uncharacterised protein [Mycobacterium tuberculosis]|nr:Uncharacterised protein [Mycobacterium tuberculosis]